MRDPVDMNGAGAAVLSIPLALVRLRFLVDVSHFGLGLRGLADAGQIRGCCCWLLKSRLAYDECRYSRVIIS